MGEQEDQQAQLETPEYSYGKNIATPKQMGMGSSGAPGALADNISGLMLYTDLLLEGDGAASLRFNKESDAPTEAEWNRMSRSKAVKLRRKARKPLGDRFYMATGAKCKDRSGKEHDRYSFIDNIPSGKLPFIQTNSTAPKFQGIIPGIAEGITNLNPSGLFKVFASSVGGSGYCHPTKFKEVRQTLNSKGVPLSGKHTVVAPKDPKYVLEAELADLNEDLWREVGESKPKFNPTTGAIEAFENRNKNPFKMINQIMNKNFNNIDNIMEKTPKMTKVSAGYFLLLSALLGFILVKTHTKSL